MISIVTYGRNDNYSFNLVKRTAFSFNCLAEVLTEDDEILFVDYNTPDHLPTLPEFIWDTLTDKALKIVKVIRISRKLHEVLKRDSPLPVLEGVSRNAAIVRSNPKNHWILSTNPDVLLVLCSRWANLDELLRTISDSFYEMPRFDIPESVWSSLHRGDPNTNMAVLRNWLISHKVAVAETVPDWQYQKVLLFDAPGDFQLAPREFFFRLHGFDESMNKYLHSDSNLAKRMWLLNGCRTDHLMGNLWVLHQDHYLTGEWARNFGTIVHNDSLNKVFHQKIVKANGENWGLQDISLPMFSLSDKVAEERTRNFRLPALVNGDLPLSKELDWQTQSIYRLSHYDPGVLTVYLRENLQVAAFDSRVVYAGRNPVMLGGVRRMWEDVSHSGVPVCDLSEVAERGESVPADVLLVDCYYERSEYWEKRIQLVQEQMRQKAEKGQVSEREASMEASEFANHVDSQAWLNGLVPLWKKLLPHVLPRPGSSIILLGCNLNVGLTQFKEAFMSSVGRGSLSDPQKGDARGKGLEASSSIEDREAVLPPVRWNVQRLMRKAFHKRVDPQGPIEFTRFYQPAVQATVTTSAAAALQPLYVHHRIVVLRVS